MGGLRVRRTLLVTTTALLGVAACAADDADTSPSTGAPGTSASTPPASATPATSATSATPGEVTTSPPASAGDDVRAESAWYLGLPTTATLVDADGAPAGRALRTGVGTVLDVLPGADGSTVSIVDVVAAEGVAPEDVAVKDVDGRPHATQVRMGAITVPLDSHLAVEYAARAGLVELIDTGRRAGITVDLQGLDRFTAGCSVAGAAAVDPASTTTAPPPPLPPGVTLPPRDPSDKTIYGWFMGMPVVPNITLPAFYGGTGPDAPSPDVPDLRVYLTGPVDEDAPLAPAREVPTAQGLKALPAHQDTVGALPDSSQPHDALGYFVVAGPAGDEASVRVRPDPPNSIPGAPMAYQIRIADRWVPLNNHIVIEYGLATGLLELRPFEFGGLMWTPFPDETQMAVTCEPTGVAVSDVGRVTAGTIEIQNEAGRETTPAVDGADVLTVRARSFEFDPADATVTAGAPFNVDLGSDDAVHDLVVEGIDGYVIADAGESATGGFAAAEAGAYTFYCSISGHREAGMEGVLTVEDVDDGG